MNFHAYYRDVKPVTTCLIGTGDFGNSFITQSERMALMSTRVAVDLDAGRAGKAFLAAGVDRARIAVCTTAGEAKAAWESGKAIATSDVAVALDLPVDVVVEATGDPEGGARHARMSIEADKHLVMVSKEADSVVGPGIAAMANARGRVVTPVDGDQPSLLIGLVTWAETLGFEIVAAGKSSEYDFVFDAARETIDSNGRVIDVPGFGALDRLGDRDCAGLVAERTRLAARLPQKLVPDLCEMTLVSNHTGLMADRADLHVPIARIEELPTLFRLQSEGGLLSEGRRIDVFQCMRAPHELSFAGGVFVVVRCTDRATWRLLAHKGHVLSRDGSTALLWLPRHLLGLEAATSVLDAAGHGVSSGAVALTPHTDLAMIADRDFAAGEVLHMGGHHHEVADASARMIPAAPLSAEAPAPFYLVSNRTLVRPVAKGEMFRLADVEIEPGSELLALRKSQDSHFFAAA
ncbi:flagellar biosynthesis protein FlgA [Acuticoccus sediminis]|uniref:Flagellar biosynthesis protein FlgA n=1 Tax=Acuticoccus sediminis TaxID=2184697 RepID=A0A8B2NT21_9HYPH|nr:flagellar biosynthesis protein FlgA [Acuticoccus sediminis]RAI02081.1 flagellar biosynthesis protein FlgA [Acuticoccus sediminis]